MLKKKLINNLISFLAILHFSFAIILNSIPLIVSNKKILNIIYYYILFVFLGWIIFDGRCWLSIIEKNLYKIAKKKPISEKLIVQYFYYWFGFRISDAFSEKIFWTVTYTSMIILCSKINKLEQGYCLIFGWILFKKAVVDKS